MNQVVQKSKNATFRVKDCALITRMAGISSVMNLRELRERLAVCPLESLYHHFCETQIRASFGDPEFRNDFAVWASRYRGDRVLAGKQPTVTLQQAASAAFLPPAVQDIEQCRGEHGVAIFTTLA